MIAQALVVVVALVPALVSVAVVSALVVPLPLAAAAVAAAVVVAVAAAVVFGVVTFSSPSVPLGRLSLLYQGGRNHSQNPVQTGIREGVGGRQEKQ